MTPADTATDRLAALRAEQAGLADEINDARRSGDVERWLALDLRREDLPGEIAAAEREGLALKVEQAWADAEACLPGERAAADAVTEAEREVSDLRRSAPGGASAAVVEHAAKTARASEALAAARQSHRDAQDATGLAIAHAEDLEAALVASGGTIEPGEGLRAHRVLTVNVTASANPNKWGALSERFRQEYGDQTISLTEGQTPPRWMAHRLGAHVFDPRPPESSPRHLEGEPPGTVWVGGSDGTTPGTRWAGGALGDRPLRRLRGVRPACSAHQDDGWAS